jgi:hypothetical protein
VHRFLLPGVDSEFASDGNASDRIFGSSSLYCLGLVLAPRFFSQRLAQNFSQQSASFAVGRIGSKRDRRGGFLMQLKEVLAVLLQNFIKFERQANPTPATLLNSFKDTVVGETFEFLAQQDWEEVAKQNREVREHDDA